MPLQNRFFPPVLSSTPPAYQLSVTCQAAQTPHHLFWAPVSIAPRTSVGLLQLSPFQGSPICFLCPPYSAFLSSHLGYILSSSEGRHSPHFPPGISLNLNGVCLHWRRTKPREVFCSVKEGRFSAASALIQTCHSTTFFGNGALVL